VRGNHDDHAGDPPPEARMAVVDEPWPLGPFTCCHHPQTQPGTFVLAGHLHPVHTLRGPGRDRLRLPCFVADAAGAVLPAFGAFTGGHVVAPAAGQGLYGVGAGRVWALPEGR
jgi:metallophosphoesterase superfamily enzyme